MKTRNKITSIVACLCIVFVAVLAAIPMFTLTASAEEANGTWTLVTDASTLNAGDTIVIACNSKQKVAGSLSGKYLTSVDCTTFSSDKKTIETLPSDAAQFVLDGGAGNWTMKAGSTNISWNGSDLNSSSTNKWTISVTSAGVASIAATSNASNKIQYNSSSPRFKTYTSSQTAIQIYKLELGGCQHTDFKTVTVESTCTVAGSVTKTCNECGETFSTAPLALKAHNYVDGFCSECGKVEAHWVLKPLSEITATDKVVITMSKSGKTYAMTNDNGTGSAPSAVAVTVVETELDGEIADNLLWNIATSGSNYTIYPNGVTNKWLYCTNTNNGVRVGDNENNTFEMDGSGYFKHIDTNRFLGVYNNADWRCYTTNTGSSNITGQTFAFYVYTEPTTEPESPEITGASIKIGDTLAMEYYVSLCSDQNIDDYTMNFTMNGNAVNGVKYNKVVDGKYVFTFTNIAPQCMGDNIAAELVCGDEVVDTKAEYSVKANAEWLLESYKDNTALVTLVNDLLNYGAAAQEYRDYNTENLVTDKDTTTDVKPEKSDMTLTESTDETVNITAAGVYFDYNNKIYVKFTAENAENVTVKINGVEATYDAYGAGYIAYTEAISAVEFGEVYTIELAVDGVVVQTLTYSVNSYAYAKWGTDELTAMNKLARALYAYGVSAEAYAATLD